VRACALGNIAMKLKLAFSATTALVGVASLGLLQLASCNTIKGILGGDKDKKETTEAEPTTAAVASSTAPSEPSVAPTGSAEAEASASAAASAAVPQIQAANEADVKRFDDETKLDAPQDTKLKEKVANVIKEPPAGELVAVLQPGTAVKTLSERDGFTLLAFENPGKPGEFLMGWTKSVDVEPVAAASAAPTPTADCVPGLTKVVVGNAERCELVCTSSAGCPTGKACSGSGKAGDAAVKFCASGSAAPPSTTRQPPPASTRPPPGRLPKEPPPAEEPSKKKKKAKKKASDG
jgi:hypothetical protein